MRDDDYNTTELEHRCISAGNRSIFVDVKENDHGVFFSIRERRKEKSSRISFDVVDGPRVAQAIMDLAKQYC